MVNKYKCKTNVELGCGDTCCKFCLGANECKYACTGRPDECRMSKGTDDRRHTYGKDK